jgi:ribosome-associated translation inhibitor RaiA
MIIQLNAAGILNIHELFENELKNRISKKLQRLSGYITSLEVHITDENGIKTGPNDIKCILEAHLKGMKSIVVSQSANTLEESVHGAIDKLKDSVDSIIERARDHEHHSTT